MTDPELERIAHEGVHGASDDLETLVGLSGRVEIAGREFPAPCTGVLALLEQIASPFVAEGRPEVDQLDVFRALYVLSEREKVLMPILRAKRLESQLERLPEPKDAASMYIVMEQRRKLAEAQAGFDADALAFGTTLGRFDLTEAIRDIGAYLTLAGGFEMLPDPEDGSKKKARWDSDLLTIVAVTAAALLPSLTMHDIFWRLPYSTVSWLFVQSARKKGVKGIGSKKTDDALFKRWQEINGQKQC